MENENKRSHLFSPLPPSSFGLCYPFNSGVLFTAAHPNTRSGSASSHQLILPCCVVLPSVTLENGGLTLLYSTPSSSSRDKEDDVPTCVGTQIKTIKLVIRTAEMCLKGAEDGYVRWRVNKSREM